jgi:hypothetical protein
MKEDNLLLFYRQLLYHPAQEVDYRIKYKLLVRMRRSLGIQQARRDDEHVDMMFWELIEGD